MRQVLFVPVALLALLALAAVSRADPPPAPAPAPTVESPLATARRHYDRRQYDQALQLYRAHGDRRGELAALKAIRGEQHDRKQFAKVIETATLALAIQRELHNRACLLYTSDAADE